MPELAEVEFFRKQWDPGIRSRILRIHWHPEKRVFRGLSVSMFLRQIRGKILCSSHTHGKQMLFQIEKNGWLGIHLGMTGKLFTRPSTYSPGPHDHLVLVTRKHSLVYHDPRLFGRIRFHHSPAPPPWWSRLPPPILSPAFHLSHLQAICRRRAKTPLKALLLRQDCFPGIGNWMADEILWQNRLHPKTKAGRLDSAQIRRLHLSIRKISCHALRTIGRDWSDPPSTWLFQHRWKPGGFCPRCGRGLARGSVGGRTTCWCSSCQGALPRRAKTA